MSVNINAGAQLKISAALPSSLDLAGFAALAYTPVRGVKQVDELERSYRTAECYPMGARQPYARRIGLNAYAVGVTLYRLADPGQTLLGAALSANTSGSFCLQRRDGSALYFTGAPSSRRRLPRDPKAAEMLTYTIQAESELVESSL